MTSRRRLAARPLRWILASALVLVAGGCGPASTASSPHPSASATVAPAPSLTPVPGGPASPVVGATLRPPTTTDVAGFGTIFDGLPPSFPKLLGQEPATTTGGATSGTFAANLDAPTAIRLMASLLEGQGWTVDAGSPLEDGTVVLEAAGRAPGCKAEVRFTPAGGTVIMSVLYGASCPFT